MFKFNEDLYNNRMLLRKLRLLEQSQNLPISQEELEAIRKVIQVAEKQIEFLTNNQGD